MKSLFQAFLALFQNTGTKLVNASNGNDVTPEQLEQLGSSEQFAAFATDVQGARIDEVKATVEAGAAQLGAVQQELAQMKTAVAAMQQAFAGIAEENAQLKAQLQAAQETATKANEQAEAVSKAVNLQRSAALVVKEPLQTANAMLKDGTHTAQADGAKLGWQESLRQAGLMK